MNAIEIKELKKYYGKSGGVENISLTVEEGASFYPSCKPQPMWLQSLDFGNIAIKILLNT